MATKKKKIIEKINDGKEKSLEAVKNGKIIEGDAKVVKNLIDSIDTSIDDDDLKYVSRAEKDFSADFNKEFSEKTDALKEESEEKASEAIREATTEGKKVSDAAHKFREAASVTDAVEKNAETAEEKMKKSSDEYGDMKQKAEDMSEKTRKEVKKLRKAVDGVFG